MLKLHEILANKKVKKTDKYLFILFHENSPLQTSKIKEIAKANGWREGARANPYPFLHASDGAINLPDGWVISESGRKKLEAMSLISAPTILTPVMVALEGYVTSIVDEHKKRFVKEVVVAVREQCFRAAIVLSWVGGVYLLYNYVLSNCLTKYNAELSRRYPNKKAASSIDDLISLKESEFLSLIEHIGVLSKAELKELEACLNRRNTAGHPNNHDFSEVTVGSHVQTLITYVYQRY